MKRWRSHIKMSPGIAEFQIGAREVGFAGKDLNIQMTGSSPHLLKQGALALEDALKTYNGVSQLEDNLPFGQNQMIYQLTPEGLALGFTTESVGRQLRGAFSGRIAQTYHLPNEEIEVRVMLPKNERDNLSALQKLLVKTPSGKVVPLGTVVRFKEQQGLEVLRHTDTKLSLNVTAEVDPHVTNTNHIIADLQKKTLPTLRDRYNVSFSFEGKNKEQMQTLADIKMGMWIAVALIYIILAWVFASYGWPILIMTAIPLGFTGAILGHFIMGIDLTFLSIFGFFALAGIVVNDSIILLNRYKELYLKHDSTHSAVIETCCQRLRPVLLTSLTTIAGLTPLMFETSFQASFLIPMATSICFGLAYATVLILVVVPAGLTLYESWRLAR